MHRGTYDIGEGITGSVVAQGASMVVPDIANDDRFLNRTGSPECCRWRADEFHLRSD